MLSFLYACLYPSVPFHSFGEADENTKMAPV